MKWVAIVAVIAAAAPVVVVALDSRPSVKDQGRIAPPKVRESTCRTNCLNADDAAFQSWLKDPLAVEHPLREHPAASE